MFDTREMDGQFSRKSVPCFYELETPVVVRTMKFVEKHCGISLWPCSKKDVIGSDKGPLLIMICPVTYSSNRDATALLDSVRDGPDVFLVLIKTVSDRGKDSDDLSRFLDTLEVQTRNRVGGSCVLFFSNTDAFKMFKLDNQNAMHEIKKVVKQISQGKKWSSALPTASQVEPQFRTLTVQTNSLHQSPPSPNVTRNQGTIQIVNTPHAPTQNLTSQQTTSSSLQVVPVQQPTVTSSKFEDAWKVARPATTVSAPQTSTGFDQAWTIPRPVAAVSNSPIPNLPPPPGSHIQPADNIKPSVNVTPVPNVSFSSSKNLDVFYYFPKGSNIETQTVQYVESRANVTMKACKPQNLMVVSPLLLFAPCHKQNEDDAKAALKQARDGDDVFLVLIEPIYQDNSKAKPVHVSDHVKDRLGALASLTYSVDCHCFTESSDNLATLGEIRTFFNANDLLDGQCAMEADTHATFLTLEVRDPSDSYESYV
ncbi:uncharacterized protein LOC121382320 [Gigantopelta aegis]|uniref:uncharacterized protein LOC121382320 n=1 Tax=Gigantopelta aegis TaxID=1735272 RepID=UPI001B887D3A|nr:uncharacterized protein LOC121382320 [Gigantopelta aegis]